VVSEADTHLPEFWLSLSVAVTLLLPDVNELITLWTTLFALRCSAQVPPFI